MAFARTVTARALAREVRALDAGSVERGALETDEEGAPEEERAGVTVRCTPRGNGKFHRARWLARRVAGEELPSWACMEAVAAEALAALGLDRSIEAADRCAEPGAGGVSWPARGMQEAGEEGAGARVRGVASDARQAEGVEAVEPERLVLAAANGCAAHASARGLLAGLAEADAFELDRRLRRAVALEQRIEAEAAPLLLAIAERRLHRFQGFASLDAWARERLGISPRKLRALLRLARASERAPELGRAFAAGRLSWVQAHALVPVVLVAECAEDREAWVERAAGVSARRLAEEVDGALLRQTGAQPSAAPASSPEPETDRFFFVGPVEVVRLFRAVLCSVRRRLERASGRPASEGAAAEWMFDHAFEAWGADDPRVPREHAVFARDGWRCTVPGCTSYRNLHDHHIRFRSAGGSDALANRTTLCAWHHLRGVHQGRVRCAGTAPHGLRFELGLRPGRPPLLAFAPGETLVP